MALQSVEKQKGKRRNIKVRQQSVFCDIAFHMVNPVHSFSCSSHQGLMRKVICSQATLNISSSACIMMLKSQRGPTTKDGSGGIGAARLRTWMKCYTFSVAAPQGLSLTQTLDVFN